MGTDNKISAGAVRGFHAAWEALPLGMAPKKWWPRRAGSCGDRGDGGHGAASSSEGWDAVSSLGTSRGSPSLGVHHRAPWCRSCDLAGAWRHLRVGERTCSRCLTGWVLWRALGLHQIASSGCCHCRYFLFLVCVFFPVCRMGQKNR